MKIVYIIILSALLSSCSITSRVEQSLKPERQEVRLFPKSYNIDYENISFQTEDGIIIKGWWINKGSDITIVLSHSFGSNRSGWNGFDAKGNSHEINWLPSMKVIADEGFNLIVFDHRACGESEGDLTYFGKKESMDVSAAIEWVNKRNNNLVKFGVVGFSSGANAALRAVQKLEKNSEYKLTCVAVNLYWYERMIKNSTKFFTNIPGIMIPLINKSTTKIVGFDPKVEINPAKILSKINSQVLLVNAQFDEIGKLKDIKDIYKKGIKNTRLQILENESRFDAYHFVEKHPNEFISFIYQSLNSKKMENSIEQSAILLIEFQKTWTDKGIFRKLIKKEYTKRNVLDNTLNLLSEARENGLTIIQAPLILDKKDKKRYKKAPFPARLLKRFTKGTWKAEFTDGIYKNTDIVVKGRSSYDSTIDSNLEQILEQKKIKTIYVSGFTTDHCVKETMNSLINKGYKCILISDCTATLNSKTQMKTEKQFTTITSKQIIEDITK